MVTMVMTVMMRGVWMVIEGEGGGVRRKYKKG